MSESFETIPLKNVEEIKIPTIEERLVKLETTVKEISDSLKIFLKSRQFEEKRNTNFNERTATNTLEHILNNHLPGIVKSNMKYFYGLNKKASGYITEFDGLFILNRKGNSLDSLAKTIVVESKTTLTPPKINIKLYQLMTVRNILENMKEGKIRLNQTPKQFREMVDTFDVTSFPSDIYVIFSPKHFSNETREYFQAIQNGDITEEKYINFCFSFLKEKYFNDVINEKDVEPVVKKFVQDIIKKKNLTVEEFNDFYLQFMKLPVNPKKLIAFMEYCPSFESLIPVFETFKYKLGFFYNGTLDSYLTISSASLFGGKRKTRKVKK